METLAVPRDLLHTTKYLLAAAASFCGGCAAAPIAASILGVAACAGGAYALWRRHAQREPLVHEREPLTLVIHGISGRAWGRSLRALAARADRDDIAVINGRLDERGRPFPLWDHVHSGHELKIMFAEARRLAYGWFVHWKGAPLPPRTQMPAVIAYLDVMVRELRVPTPVVDQHTSDWYPEFAPFLRRALPYRAGIWELADVFEPVLLADYFQRCGYRAQTAVMAKIVADKGEELAVEDIAGLWSMSDTAKVHIETRMVDAHLNLYWARRLIEAAQGPQHATGAFLEAARFLLKETEKGLADHAKMGNPAAFIAAAFKELDHYRELYAMQVEALWNDPTRTPAPNPRLFTDFTTTAGSWKVPIAGTILNLVRTLR